MYHLLFCMFMLQSCNGIAQKQEKPNPEDFEVQKSESEWKEILTNDQYYILRQAGTERPYTSPLNYEEREGVFVCGGCNNPLYKSNNKYDAGCGWPSFDEAIEGSIVISYDYKLGYKRDEALCAKCGSHLGHIFNDGPRNTTGMRHCINGAALQFVSEEDFKSDNNEQ